jgi:hypothetical protein
MLKNEAERAQRQEELRLRLSARGVLEHEAQSAGLDLGQVAEIFQVSRQTARRMFRNEPGVRLLTTPGHSRPQIRVPVDVVERVLRRSTNR